MDPELGISRRNLLIHYIGRINKVLLDSTGNHVQYPAAKPSSWGEEPSLTAGGILIGAAGDVCLREAGLGQAKSSFGFQ